MAALAPVGGRLELALEFHNFTSAPRRLDRVRYVENANTLEFASLHTDLDSRVVSDVETGVAPKGHHRPHLSRGTDEINREYVSRSMWKTVARMDRHLHAWSLPPTRTVVLGRSELAVSGERAAPRPLTTPEDREGDHHCNCQGDGNQNNGKAHHCYDAPPRPTTVGFLSKIHASEDDASPTEATQKRTGVYDSQSSVKSYDQADLIDL